MIRLERIDGDSGESRGPDGFALRRNLHWTLFPSLATVLRTKQHGRGRRPCADKHVIGIYRIDADGPDIMRVQRRVDIFPVRAAVVTSVESPLRSGKKDLVLLRMHRDA